MPWVGRTRTAAEAGVPLGPGTGWGVEWALLGSYPEPGGLSSLGPRLHVLDPGHLHKPLLPGPEVTPVFSCLH